MCSAPSGSRWAVGSSRSRRVSGASAGTGQGETLALPGRQAEAVVAQVGGQATGQGGDDTVDLDRAQGLPELVVGGRMADRQAPSARSRSRGTAAGVT